MSRRVLLRLLALLGPLAASCAPAAEAETVPTPATEEAPVRSWPAGTVLAVDDLPLTAAEVAPLEAALRELYPAYVDAQLRRLALTNHFLELLAVRSRDRDARDEALAAARAAAEELRAGADPGPLETAQGTFQGLGELALWMHARRLETGAWSEPIELPGRFLLVRLDAREAGARAASEFLTISYLHFPYLDLTSGIPDIDASTDAAVDAAELTIVDPSWEETVPVEWLHRMGALDQ